MTDGAGNLPMTTRSAIYGPSSQRLVHTTPLNGSHVRLELTVEGVMGGRGRGHDQSGLVVVVEGG